MEQRFIELPDETARALRPGQEVVIDEKSYEVKSVRFDDEGNEVELVRNEDEGLKTIELEEESELEEQLREIRDQFSEQLL